MTPLLKLGQVVVFIDYGGESHPALITKIHDEECVNLCVFLDGESAHDNHPTARYLHVFRQGVAEPDAESWALIAD